MLTSMIERLKKALSRNENVYLLLAVMACAAYCLCLPNEMFWDDHDFILKNTYIKDWRFWPNFFTENIIAGNHLISNYWRPLLQTIFAIEWHLWSDWAWGWHAVAIAWHAAAAMMLFKTVHILLKGRTLAILTALLWLVHPVHTEAVVYPNSMGDALATFFVLAGIYGYARFREGRKPTRWYAMALAMYPLALLSKETGILLVAFIGLADFLLIPDEQGAAPGHYQRILRILKRIWPFILMAVVYLVLRATVLNFRNSFNFYDEVTPFTSNFWLRLGTFFRVIALDAGFIFIPYELRVERLIDTPKTLLEPDVLWGMAICAGMTILAIRNWTRRPAIAFGILWFFVAILPTCNLFVIINAMVYEHFLYAALAGILIAILTFALEWAHDARRRRLLFAAVMGIILIFTGRCAWRCLDWRTATGFYEQLLPHVPTSYRVINNLGMAYAESGSPEKALATYAKAIALDPTNAVAYHNTANIHRDAGRKDVARIYYEKALELQPNFIFSYKSLAQIYIDNNEYNKARLLLEKYYLMCDEQAYILKLLTELAFREGAHAEARNYLLMTLQLRPNDPDALAALKTLEKISEKKPVK